MGTWHRLAGRLGRAPGELAASPGALMGLALVLAGSAVGSACAGDAGEPDTAHSGASSDASAGGEAPDAAGGTGGGAGGGAGGASGAAGAAAGGAAGGVDCKSAAPSSSGPSGCAECRGKACAPEDGCIATWHQGMPVSEYCSCVGGQLRCLYCGGSCGDAFADHDVEVACTQAGAGATVCGLAGYVVRCTLAGVAPVGVCASGKCVADAAGAHCDDASEPLAQCLAPNRCADAGALLTCVGELEQRADCADGWQCQVGADGGTCVATDGG